MQLLQQRACAAAAMSGGVRSPKKRPADPSLTVLSPSPKKVPAYVCTLQNGLGTGLHVHNLGADNLRMYNEQVLQMRAGEIPDSETFVWTM